MSLSVYQRIVREIKHLNIEDKIQIITNLIELLPTKSHITIEKNAILERKLDKSIEALEEYYEAYNG